jgi:hypothetical protein
MVIPMVELQHFDQKALRRIKAQVSAILTKWGVPPRFKRWRLTQDPDTGMIVLFGILNNGYIAKHTSTPFRDYFDPRLLHDLANELQVQVVSCNSEGLRYAFILDRGQLGKLPTHIDFPVIDNGKLLARVVYSDSPGSVPAAPADIAAGDDHRLVQNGVGAFLKVFDDINLRAHGALQLPSQNQPDFVVIDEDEFNKRLAEHEVNRRRSELFRELIDKPVDSSRG